MKNLTKLSIFIAASLLIFGSIIVGGSNRNKNGINDEPIKVEPALPKKAKEIKTLFLPMGGFTSGFLYCGFDGEKSILEELINEGWEVESITPQNFETSKRNGDIVLCNGSYYILER